MVTLSDVAAEKLRAILVEEKAEEKGLRIRVVPGGCSGFSYDMASRPRSRTTGSTPCSPDCS